jgi:hypothetical protein
VTPKKPDPLSKLMTSSSYSESLAGKLLQAITSVALVLVGFITVSALDKISDIDEKLNTHIVVSEHRLTVLEHD